MGQQSQGSSRHLQAPGLQAHLKFRGGGRGQGFEEGVAGMD